MSPDQMLQVAKQFILTHNQPNYKDAFDGYFQPDIAVHEYLPGLPDTMNRAIYEQFIAGFRAAMPDITNAIEDVFATGDRVAIRWSGTGTHTGADLMGIPAAGHKVKAHGIYIMRFANGKIAEVWDNWDNINVAEQLRGKV